MKTIAKYLAIFGAVMFSFTSCVQDLNVTPHDENKNIEFNQDAMFTKCYAMLGLTGQNGPAGNPDVDYTIVDEGFSSFLRMNWLLNELPSDGLWCNWNDPGFPDLRTMKWTSTNGMVKGCYYRLYVNITMCNHFLENATEDGDGANQIAEVRLLRALFYTELLDKFGSVPFTDKVNAQKKPQYTRQEMFEWVEQELLDLEGKLPVDRLSDYRVDRVAAQMLLARIYLNAGVYTGTARWQDAATYAKKVMNSNYKLHTTSLGGIYTPYQEMFMGDNHRVLGRQSGEGNGEAIILVYQDGVNAQSWGGSLHHVAGFRDAEGYMATGSKEGWSGFRSTPEFLLCWLDKLEDAPTIQENEFDMPAKLGDDRAILCSKLTNDRILGDTVTYMPLGNMGEFFDSWSVLKWTGRYIENEPGDIITVDPHHSQFVDTDVPLIRVAEAYLTYAEAQHRLGNDGEARNAIQVLRDRAHNTKEFTIDNQFLLDEWSREFYAEGRRRTDLVRFGKFAGPNANYHWEGRGGNRSDQGLVVTAKRFNVFPIPETDIIAGGLTQSEEGY